MKLFRVRLEAQDDSGHYRETDIQAPDTDTAQAWCEQHERKLAAFTLSDAEVQKLEKLEQKPGHPRLGQLAGANRAHLIAHRQQEPYKVVSVKELK